MPARAGRLRASGLQFENLKAPRRRQAVADLDVENTPLDLHQHFRLVGLTYGVDPSSATLGWAAVSPLRVIRGGQAVPIQGLALHFSGLIRFEVACDGESPGQLDYFELRDDPEPTLIFFFESATVRIAGAACRAELVTESDEEVMDAGAGGSGGDPGLVQ